MAWNFLHWRMMLVTNDKIPHALLPSLRYKGIPLSLRRPCGLTEYFFPTISSAETHSTKMGLQISTPTILHIVTYPPTILRFLGLCEGSHRSGTIFTRTRGVVIAQTGDQSPPYSTATTPRTAGPLDRSPMLVSVLVLVMALRPVNRRTIACVGSWAIRQAVAVLGILVPV